MDKLKRVFSPGSGKDDEVMYNTPEQGDSSGRDSSGATGKVTGQGSHFPSSDAGATQSATETGPLTTTGVNTASTPLESKPVEPTETYATSRIESTRGTADDGAERAALGNTSTYSSTPLARGDPTSSVIDPSSSDPTTFRKPEASSAYSSTDPASTEATSTGAGSANAGVGSGAALAAASRAFSNSQADSNMPGGFPGDVADNPYASSNLDPRVDAGQSRTAGETIPHTDVRAPTTAGTTAPLSEASRTDTTSGIAATGGGESHLGRDAALTGAATGVGVGAYEASRPAETTTSTATASDPSSAIGQARTTDTAIPASQVDPSRTKDSTIPTTTNQASYSATPATSGAVAGGTETGVKDDIPAHVGGPPSSYTAQEPEKEKKGVKGKILGALGLGAGAAGTKETYDDRKAEKDSSAIGGSSSAPTGPPSHHRKESIPTTAYPAGSLDSTQAVSPPVGGTRSGQATDAKPQTQVTPSGYADSASQPSTTRGTIHDAVTGSPSGDEARLAAVREGAIGSGARTGTYEASRPTETTLPTTTSSDPTRRDESHLGRDTAVAGAAGIAAGGALAEHGRHRGDDQIAKDPNAAREQQFQDVRDMPYGTKEEQKSADKEAAAAVSGLSGAAGFGLGKTEAASSYRDDEIDKQRNLDDPEGRALGAPGLGSGAKDAARQYRESEHEKQQGLSDPDPATYQGGGLGSGLRDAGAAYSARELEREKGTGHEPTEAGATGAVAGAGTSKVAEQGVAGHEDTGERRPSQSMFGLSAADAADKEKYDYKHKSKHGKPGFFRRIFKTRKNVDTGDDEQYSSEEEHPGPHHPTEETSHSGDTTTFNKPTYNPLKKVEPVDDAGHV